MASKIEVVMKVRQVLASHCEDPSRELQTLGHAIMEIGRALEGLSLPEARAVMQGVAALEGLGNLD